MLYIYDILRFEFKQIDLLVITITCRHMMYDRQFLPYIELKKIKNNCIVEPLKNVKIKKTQVLTNQLYLVYRVGDMCFQNLNNTDKNVLIVLQTIL